MMTVIVPKITEALLADGVNYLIDGEVRLGVEEVDLNTEPPKIAVVPTGDTFEMVTHSFSNQVSNPLSAVEAKKIQNARALRTRWCGGEAHIWAKDYTQGDELVRAFISALDDLSHGFYKVGPGKWVQAQKVIASGRYYVLVFSVATLVTKTPYINAPSNTIAGLTQCCGKS